jgi:uncharacterized protein YcnI
MKKFTVLLAVLAVLLVPAAASAHAKVLPYKVGTEQDKVFSLSVPNEGTTPTTKVKLLIPDGVKYVSPVARDDWTITTKKAGNGDVTAITWADGKIPTDRSGDFQFRAATPDHATELDWKIYQTYAGGIVVAWDQKPQQGKREAKSKNAGPYSVTQVNPKYNPKAAANHANQSGDSNAAPLTLSIVAIVLAIIGIILALSRQKLQHIKSQRKNKS